LLIWRREVKRSVTHAKLRTALLVASAAPLLIPIAGFAAGTPPADAREVPPADAGVVAEGIEASLPGAPAGTYQVVEHRGTLIAASIAAGGDTFEARFAGDPRGHWRGDPSDLEQPMSGEIYVAAGSVKTGIDLRDEHAAEAVGAREFSELGFEITRITGSAADGERRVRFRGEGRLQIMGRSIPTDVNGTVTELDAGAKKRQAIGAAAALVVNATLEIDLRQTPIDTTGGTFDNMLVPIRVSLVLINEGESR
jgi:hypothetical protein